ncbi:hypothetical protein ACSNOD_27920, partial [Streptomyces sp. URMC 123]
MHRFSAAVLLLAGPALTGCVSVTGPHPPQQPAGAPGPTAAPRAARPQIVQAPAREAIATAGPAA